MKSLFAQIAKVLSALIGCVLLVNCATVEIDNTRLEYRRISHADLPGDLVGEESYNNAFCKIVGGAREVRHEFSFGDGKKSYVLVDCETTSEVIEAGLDKRSSLDSIQQAMFFATITGKRPVVVIYDTDGKEGNYEYQIRRAVADVRINRIP